MTLASRGAHGIVSAGAIPYSDAGADLPACAASPELERSAERNDMPVIKLNDQQFSLRPGPNRLGAGADADVCVDDDDALGVQAIVEVAGNDNAVIRRVGDAPAPGRPIVRVNGIPLVDPTPLIHGDKVEIAGRELLYADDTKAGATQYVSAAAIAAIAQSRPAAGGRATTATGGRLVSLVDGKDYLIPDTGVVIGRDAGSDVVVAQNDVSRKHAEVVPVESGYALRDLSANGVFVNGARVDRTQLLARSDVIRVGSEEFRFYADVAPTPVASQIAMAPAPDPLRTAVAPPSAPTPPMPGPAASAAPAAPPTVTSVAPESVPALALTQSQRPAQLPPVLAVLEVTNEGPSKGHLYSVHVPLAHIGRGAHNDVVVADDSVSDSHAKLQQRDDGWYLIDVGSTNGSYVSGHRLTAERRLDGAPDVRFGGVKMVFRSLETAAGRGAATRAIASVDRSQLRPASGPPPSTVASSAPDADAPRTLPVWLWLSVLIVVAALAAFFMMNH